MPKKNLLIAGAAVVLLLIVGAGLMMSNSSKKTDSESTVSQGTANDSSEASTTKGSIKSLFSAGKNVTCTVTYPDNGGGGTMFIADKKMRGDFLTSDSGGKQVESHMILDGETSYSWMGLEGVKMKIDANVKASPAPGSATEATDLDKEADMNCSRWSVDNSKFIVPTDVKFTDLSGFIQQTQTQNQTQTGGSSGSGGSASACDSIADPATKAACISALGGGN